MKKIFRIIYNFGYQMKEDNLNSYASSSAFFIFLSIVPMVMLLFSIIPYTPIDPKIVNEWILSEFPSETGAFIISIFEEVSAKSTSMLLITSLATLWSAGKGVNSLIYGFNAIDRFVDKRNWVILRLVSCLYTLIFLAGLIVILFMMVGGTFLSEHAITLFPDLSNVIDHLVNFRTVISIVLLSVVFMLCYSLLPYKKHKFRETFPGAIVSAVIWTAFSYLFTFFVNRFNPFSMYGSLTTIIVLLIWLYFCMYILFIGDNLNKYFSPVIQAILTSGRNIDEVKGSFKKL